MTNYNIIKMISIASAITVVVIFTGCVFLSPDDSPSEIVKKFVSFPNYYLMSEDYKKSVNEENFQNKINKCKPNFKYYEFVEIINGSEKIKGDSATVEIQYLEKYDEPLGDPFGISKITQKTKNKTIYLIKENEGWRLRDLSCELVGR